MSDYLNFSEKELREYVKANPQDEEAFQYFLTIIRAKPGRVVVNTEEQLEAELRKRLAS
ncbi:MAG: hypothetical protein KME23_15585 [Goleter apudmare HA4340-LM2]|jgi:predicted Ser/Thr protein kinase|nr:hypothetical protein [Goleter apudmare HA4340-LM2]